MARAWEQTYIESAIVHSATCARRWCGTHLRSSVGHGLGSSSRRGERTLILFRTCSLSLVAARSAGAVCSSRPSAGRCLACVGFKSTFEFDVEFRIAVLKVLSVGLGSRDLRSVSSLPFTRENNAHVR